VVRVAASLQPRFLQRRQRGVALTLPLLRLRAGPYRRPASTTGSGPPRPAGGAYTPRPYTPGTGPPRPPFGGGAPGGGAPRTPGRFQRRDTGPPPPLMNQNIRCATAPASRRLTRRANRNLVPSRLSRTLARGSRGARPDAPLPRSSAATVRLIDEDKEMVGVCTREEALKAAEEAGLDLVRAAGVVHGG
jgi:hypothetical protein